MRQVAAVLGDPPFRLQSSPQELCWLYGRSRDDLRGGTVCFTGGHVSFVATSELASVEFYVTTTRVTGSLSRPVGSAYRARHP